MTRSLRLSAMPHELIDLLDGFVNLFAEVPGPLIAQCSAYLIAASIAWCLFAQVRYRMMPRYGRTPIPTGAVIVFFFTSSAFTLLTDVMRHVFVKQPRVAESRDRFPSRRIARDSE